MVSRDKAAKSVLWTSLEAGGLAFVSFVTLIIFTRLLSASDFGVFSVSLALTELLGVIVSMLFHDALIQRRNVTDVHFDTAFTATMAISVALMAATMAGAPAFGYLVGQPAAASVVFWLSLCFPLSGFSATIMARQRRDLEFQALAMRSLAGRLSGAAVGVGAAVLGAGLWSFVAQQVVMAGVGSGVLWAMCHNRPRLRFRRAEFLQLLTFGILSVGTLFVSFSIKRLFIIIAGAFLGAVPAGFLNLSFRVVDVFWSISATAVCQVAMPMLAGLQDSAARVRRAYGLAVAFTCVCLYSVFVGLGATAPEVVELLFGREWLPSSPYVTALALLVIVQAPRLLATPALTASGRPSAPLAGAAVQLAFMLAASFATAIPSVPWAIAIWALGETLVYPVFLGMVTAATGMTVADQTRGIVVPLVAAAVMAAEVTVMRGLIGQAWPVALRLAALASSGAATFAAVLAVIDRALFAELAGFVSKMGRGPMPASAQ